jgi:hypothetical protein
MVSVCSARLDDDCVSQLWAGAPTCMPNCKYDNLFWSNVVVNVIIDSLEKQSSQKWVALRCGLAANTRLNCQQYDGFFKVFYYRVRRTKAILGPPTCCSFELCKGSPRDHHLMGHVIFFGVGAL